MISSLDRAAPDRTKTSLVEIPVRPVNLMFLECMAVAG